MDLGGIEALLRRTKTTEQLLSEADQVAKNTIEQIEEARFLEEDLVKMHREMQEERTMEHLVVCTIFESNRTDHLISKDYQGSLLHKTVQAFSTLYKDMRGHKWADMFEVKFLKQVNGNQWGEPKLIAKGRRETFPFLVSEDTKVIMRHLVEMMLLSPEDIGEPSILLGPTDNEHLWHVQRNDDQRVYEDDNEAAACNFKRVRVEDSEVYASDPTTPLARWCLERLRTRFTSDDKKKFEKLTRHAINYGGNIGRVHRGTGMRAVFEKIYGAKTDTDKPVTPESWKAIRLADQEKAKSSNYAMPGLELEIGKLTEHYPGYRKGVTVINGHYFHIEAVEVNASSDLLEVVHENNKEFYLNICGLGFERFSTLPYDGKQYVVVITPFGD